MEKYLNQIHIILKLDIENKIQNIRNIMFDAKILQTNMNFVIG